jgi:hypothetical protein
MCRYNRIHSGSRHLVEIAPRSATMEDRDSKLRASSCMEKRTECLVAADFHKHERASEAKLLAPGRRWALGIPMPLIKAEGLDTAYPGAVVS